MSAAPSGQTGSTQSGSTLAVASPTSSPLFSAFGPSWIFGGPGNDIIHAVDGVKGTIDCGTGHDIVYADRHDKVAKNCEAVHRS